MPAHTCCHISTRATLPVSLCVGTLSCAPTKVSRAWSAPVTQVNGSFFMTSQLAYLRGLDCSRDEVHFLCQERFDSDWNALLAAFGQTSTAPGGSWHVHMRNVTSSSTSIAKPSRAQRIARRAALQSELSAPDQEFIRTALYPWDAALHQLICA